VLLCLQGYAAGFPVLLPNRLSQVSSILASAPFCWPQIEAWKRATNPAVFAFCHRAVLLQHCSTC
jgi:hypothetical protein